MPPLITSPRRTGVLEALHYERPVVRRKPSTVASSTCFERSPELLHRTLGAAGYAPWEAGGAYNQQYLRLIGRQPCLPELVRRRPCHATMLGERRAPQLGGRRTHPRTNELARGGTQGIPLCPAVTRWAAHKQPWDRKEPARWRRMQSSLPTGVRETYTKTQWRRRGHSKRLAQCSYGGGQAKDNIRQCSYGSDTGPDRVFGSLV